VPETLISSNLLEKDKYLGSKSLPLLEAAASVLTKLKARMSRQINGALVPAMQGNQCGFVGMNLVVVMKTTIATLLEMENPTTTHLVVVRLTLEHTEVPKAPSKPYLQSLKTMTLATIIMHKSWLVLPFCRLTFLPGAVLMDGCLATCALLIYLGDSSVFENELHKWLTMYLRVRYFIFYLLIIEPHIKNSSKYV
jgi:hypothetical protein